MQLRALLKGSADIVATLRLEPPTLLSASNVPLPLGYRLTQIWTDEVGCIA